MEKLISNGLKISVSILLILCLASMPYGYYEFVRFFVMGACIFLSYYAVRHEKQELAIFYVLIAVLFQPLLRINLGKPIWIVIDIGLAVFLLFTLDLKRQKSK